MKKPPRAERTHSKAYKVMLTRDEMDVLAAVAGRYFDSMREQGVILPPKVSLNALHALHKFRKAIRETAPVIVLDEALPPPEEDGVKAHGLVVVASEEVGNAGEKPG